MFSRSGTTASVSDKIMDGRSRDTSIVRCTRGHAIKIHTMIRGLGVFSVLRKIAQSQRD